MEPARTVPTAPMQTCPVWGGWDYQQQAMEGVKIELTSAAPSTVSVDRAVAYRSEILREERDELSEEYKGWLERREGD